MQRLVVTEHTRIERSHQSGVAGDRHQQLEARLYDRLREFDKVGRGASDRVFDWSDGFTRTTQWVGVVQAPGVQVEILPKIDALVGEDAQAESVVAQFEARRNLLYMLAVSGDVPLRSREVARLATRRAPLSETLSAIFATRLRDELMRGPNRGYQLREENLRGFRGKLLVSRQIQLNTAHRERFYCSFEEFSDDTLMNRIFNAACRVLLSVTRMSSTQDVLRHCMLLLDNVSDGYIDDSDFNRIAINRQNERFADILRFCRLILADRSPTVEAGGTQTFSLLFDMNKVYERFVAAFLQRYVAGRFEEVRIYPHAGHRKRHLMESAGAGVLRLEPDVLIEGPFGRRLVVDLKWKVLAAGRRGLGGVSEADLYQLYAYTRRYGSQTSVLLYPHMKGLESRDFDVLDADGNRRERVSVRQVRLHRNLQREDERAALADELEQIIRDGLGLNGHDDDASGAPHSIATS